MVFDVLRFSSIFFDFLWFSLIFFDFERRAGSGAAGDRNINGFQLKAFRKASILSAGPVRERPGIEKSTVFIWKPLEKHRFWAPGRVGSGTGRFRRRFLWFSSIFFDFLRFSSIFFDFLRFRLARAANRRFSAQIWGFGVQKRGNRCDLAENPAFLNFKLLFFFMRIPYIYTKSVSTYAQNSRKTYCKR